MDTCVKYFPMVDRVRFSSKVPLLRQIGNTVGKSCEIYFKDTVSYIQDISQKYTVKDLSHWYTTQDLFNSKIKRVRFILLIHYAGFISTINRVRLSHRYIICRIYLKDSPYNPVSKIFLNDRPFKEWYSACKLFQKPFEDSFQWQSVLTLFWRSWTTSPSSAYWPLCLVRCKDGFQCTEYQICRTDLHHGELLQHRPKVWEHMRLCTCILLFFFFFLFVCVDFFFWFCFVCFFWFYFVHGNLYTKYVFLIFNSKKPKPFRCISDKTEE